MAFECFWHDVRQRRETWYKAGLAWQGLHYLLGLLAVVATALLGITTVHPDGKTRAVLAISSTICIAVVSFLNPAKLGFAYINAWRLLDSALRRYEGRDDQHALEQINIAIDQGERMIATNEPFSGQQNGVNAGQRAA